MDENNTKQTELPKEKIDTPIHETIVLNKPLFDLPAAIARHPMCCKCRPCLEYYEEV